MASDDSIFAESSVNQYTTKRRTSVLYDFSSVLKARFYVFDVDPNGIIQNKGGNPIVDTLYVQINPSNISISSDAARRVTRPNGNIKGQVARLVPGNSGNYKVDDMTIKLQYDLYDEFSIGTMDGMLAPYTIDRHLKSRTATSMERLIELSRVERKAVLFKWGPIQYFGAVSSADFEYKAFSRFGDPLKADGTVKLTAFGFTIGTNGEIKYALDFGNNPLDLQAKTSFNALMEGYDTKEKAMLTAEIGATQALR